MARLDETFQDKGEGANRAVSLANQIRNYPLEIAEREPYLWLKEDPASYQLILDHLRPDNMLAILAAKGVPTDRTEKYYGTKYSYTEDSGPAYQALLNPPEVAAIRSEGYEPRAIVDANPELAGVLNAIRDGVFSPEEPGRYQSIYDMLVNWGDHYLLLADYASYLATQERVDLAYQQTEQWTRQAVINVAGMGPFSADRTIAEYAETIWRTEPLAAKIS